MKAQRPGRNDGHVVADAERFVALGRWAAGERYGDGGRTMSAITRLAVLVLLALAPASAAADAPQNPGAAYAPLPPVQLTPAVPPARHSGAAGTSKKPTIRFDALREAPFNEAPAGTAARTSAVPPHQAALAPPARPSVAAPEPPRRMRHRLRAAPHRTAQTDRHRRSLHRERLARRARQEVAHRQADVPAGALLFPGRQARAERPALPDRPRGSKVERRLNAYAVRPRRPFDWSDLGFPPGPLPPQSETVIGAFPPFPPPFPYRYRRSVGRTYPPPFPYPGPPPLP
ncbi:MAG TPA: hypothetical protein VJ770_06955 [Stellaceae bacterium]|nr:hypothetical protein [Stellaceae bacterium]